MNGVGIGYGVVTDSPNCSRPLDYPKFCQEAYRHYEMGRKVYIFNHTQFSEKNGKAPRKGAKRDTELLLESFGRLKYHVYVHYDLSKDEIFEVLKEVSRQPTSKLECVVFVISTYGAKNQLYAFDTTYDEKELLNALKGKLPGIPKLFFIQCGREDSKELESLPEEDMLVMYSAKAGHSSYRNVDTGGWFINALTQHLDRLDTNSNLLIELQHVKCTVEREFAAKNSTEQSPFICTRLTKDFIIGPEVIPDLTSHCMEVD